MRILYGNINSWINSVPMFVHRWKCEHLNPMNTFVEYPDAFSNPMTTLPIDTFFVDTNDLGVSLKWDEIFIHSDLVFKKRLKTNDVEEYHNGELSDLSDDD